MTWWNESEQKTDFKMSAFQQWCDFQSMLNLFWNCGILMQEITWLGEWLLIVLVKCSSMTWNLNNLLACFTVGVPWFGGALRKSTLYMFVLCGFVYKKYTVSTLQQWFIVSHTLAFAPHSVCPALFYVSTRSCPLSEVRHTENLFQC